VIPERPTPPPRVHDCDDVDIASTSNLIPNDWDEWCDGLGFAVDNMAELTASGDFAALDEGCDGFWSLSDEDILDELMYVEGISRDFAIGMIDALWLVC
jgi:hypothetical protein